MAAIKNTVIFIVEVIIFFMVPSYIEGEKFYYTQELKAIIRPYSQGSKFSQMDLAIVTAVGLHFHLKKLEKLSNSIENVSRIPAKKPWLKDRMREGLDNGKIIIRLQFDEDMDFLCQYSKRVNPSDSLEELAVLQESVKIMEFIEKFDVWGFDTRNSSRKTCIFESISDRDATSVTTVKNFITSDEISMQSNKLTIGVIIIVLIIGIFLAPLYVSAKYKKPMNKSVSHLNKIRQRIPINAQSRSIECQEILVESPQLNNNRSNANRMEFRNVLSKKLKYIFRTKRIEGNKLSENTPDSIILKNINKKEALQTISVHKM